MSQATATATEMTREQLLARIAELEAKNKARTSNGFKVSAKGGISVYGHGKYPVTLYLSQWEKFMETLGVDFANLRSFIEAHRSELSVKPDAE